MSFLILKNCQFHQNEICYLEYIMSAQEVQMKDKKFEEIKNWPKPKLIKDIQIFLAFTNFYQCFI